MGPQKKGEETEREREKRSPEGPGWRSGGVQTQACNLCCTTLTGTPYSPDCPSLSKPSNPYWDVQLDSLFSPLSPSACGLKENNILCSCLCCLFWNKRVVKKQNCSVILVLMLDKCTKYILLMYWLNKCNEIFSKFEFGITHWCLIWSCFAYWH